MHAAFSTVILDGQDLASGADLLAAAGVTEVEPAYIEGYIPFDETTFTAAHGQAMARLFAARGLRVRAVSAHTDLGGADGLARLLRRLDFAVGLGAEVVISNATAAANRDALLRMLDAALPRLEAACVVLALENPGHGAGALIPDGRAGAALVSSVGSNWLRLNYDIGNAFTYAKGAIDLRADLSAARPFACRLHVKDVRQQGADWHFCPPGQGIVGYGSGIPPAALSGLLMTVEHPIRLWRPGGGDPVRHAAPPSDSEVRAAITAALTTLARW